MRSRRPGRVRRGHARWCAVSSSVFRSFRRLGGGRSHRNEQQKQGEEDDLRKMKESHRETFPGISHLNGQNARRRRHPGRKVTVIRKGGQGKTGRRSDREAARVTAPVAWQRVAVETVGSKHGSVNGPLGKNCEIHRSAMFASLEAPKLHLSCGFTPSRERPYGTGGALASASRRQPPLPSLSWTVA